MLTGSVDDAGLIGIRYNLAIYYSGARSKYNVKQGLLALSVVQLQSLSRIGV